MRNETLNWIPVPDWSVPLEKAGVTVRTIEIASQHLVSGDLGRFAAKAGLANQGVGAFAVADGECLALRIARDRMLVVDAPTDLTDGGWHEDGYAVTDVSALYHVFEIDGDGLDALIGEATAMNPDWQSPSAMVMFAGQQAIAYYHQGGLRIHVERGFAPYLWQWLEARD